MEREGLPFETLDFVSFDQDKEKLWVLLASLAYLMPRDREARHGNGVWEVLRLTDLLGNAVLAVMKQQFEDMKEFGPRDELQGDLGVIRTTENENMGNAEAELRANGGPQSTPDMIGQRVLVVDRAMMVVLSNQRAQIMARLVKHHQYLLKLAAAGSELEELHLAFAAYAAQAEAAKANARMCGFERYR